MNQAPTGNKKRRIIRHAGWIMAGLSILLSTACTLSYLADSAVLKHIALQATRGITNDSEKVIALMNWVHNNKGSHENENYFVFKGLRATPLQVVGHGGDCADKSRLLCALLREINIPSTMVMCFHRETGVATHTVVEAQTTAGGNLVVDPVYGLFFPRDTAGYYGLRELRADPQILDRRLQRLASDSRTSPLRSYNPTSAAYDHACSINWNKNAVTRIAHSFLASWYGGETYNLRRPLALEEPKILVACALVACAVCVVIVTRLVDTLLSLCVLVPGMAGVAICGR